MSNYKQNAVSNGSTRFAAAPGSDVQFSKMTSNPRAWTSFNAGDIVPIYCAEVLPRDSFEVDLDAIVRQSTLLKPTMDNMELDIYAFFVPNRIVNQSWVNVMGENSSGSWTANEVNLAPLCSTSDGDVQVPIGSVADYYGFPTQAAIPNDVLVQCNDLKFRGYLEIYNQYFRDENYQPPIPYSKLNVYEGFFVPKGSVRDFEGAIASRLSVAPASVPDGSYPEGALLKAIYGEGDSNLQTNSIIAGRTTAWSALDKPLKANKLHDYFTSVLPSPQKGVEVTFKLSGEAPITTIPGSGASMNITGFHLSGFPDLTALQSVSDGQNLTVFGADGNSFQIGVGTGTNSVTGLSSASGNFGISSITKLSATLDEVSAISVDDLRMGAAIQQVYEQLARTGSRYREFVWGFFGLEVDDPYNDIPERLGHIRRNLDIYQTAQTSASQTDGTPQGNLAAFGYTATTGGLFHKTFLEHGYIHILAVVRHRNVYTSMLSRDNFRLGLLDFYVPELANISEQPVYTREINPFDTYTDDVFGYNEAWAEYRFDPDRVSGYMRTGIDESLALWNYADEFDSTLRVADSDFITSNSQEVLDRTLAVTSSVAHQFFAQFNFRIVKERPMPTYSVPGLNIV